MVNFIDVASNYTAVYQTFCKRTPMARILTIIALLFATPVWAAGSYSYEPSASKLINDAKKLIKKEKYKRAIGKLERQKKQRALIMLMFSITN